MELVKNYVATFIAAADDCRANGKIPTKEASIATTQYRLLVEEPYQHTQANVLFASSAAMRAGQPADRGAFFAKPQACLRCSPLVKSYGWGIHFDAEGRAAAYAFGSDEYQRFATDASLTQTKGMRGKR